MANRCLLQIWRNEWLSTVCSLRRYVSLFSAMISITRVKILKGITGESATLWIVESRTLSIEDVLITWMEPSMDDCSCKDWSRVGRRENKDCQSLSRLRVDVHYRTSTWLKKCPERVPRLSSSSSSSTSWHFYYLVQALHSSDSFCNSPFISVTFSSLLFCFKKKNIWVSKHFANLKYLNWNALNRRRVLFIANNSCPYIQSFSFRAGILNIYKLRDIDLTIDRKYLKYDGRDSELEAWHEWMIQT